VIRTIESEGYESKPFYVPPTNVRPYNVLRSSPWHARRSYKWRHHHGMNDLLQFNTPIQHVVVVYMENRTPDNLFASQYAASWPSTPQNFATWGTALDLANPFGLLTPKSLEWNCDPDHSHYPGFINESQSFSNETFGSASSTCQTGEITPNPYHYVTSSEVANYETLITDWAYASHVLQSNEGPSFIAHQYAIAGQSGALSNSVSPSPAPAPTGLAMAENPVVTGSVPPTPPPGSNIYYEPYVYTSGNCYTQNQSAHTVYMSRNYTTASDRSNPEYTPPCVNYPTILDSIDGALGAPPSYLDWQYIASKKDSIWAAPMAINHFYHDYSSNESSPTQPFAVDKDAENFVSNVVNGAGNPTRPFAALTYITPCLSESDHPNTGGVAEYGPEWLAWLVNSIGESQYWPNTTIIVVWDDWGGWYDHYNVGGNWPYHPPSNVYNNIWGVQQDGDEWGFRVPMMVISPYIQYPAYVSQNLRSQGAVLDYIESSFGLSSLGTDDTYNDPLTDIFNFSQSPRAYTPVPGIPTTPNPNWCGVV
jgi:hypothetical protein